MTPKDKAIDLRDKFSKIGQSYNDCEDANNAVKLILDSARYTEYHYWLKVKQELDKM